MNRLDRPLARMNLTGMFFPAYLDDDQPCLVVLEGVHFLPIFSTVEKLQEQLPIINPLAPTKVKQITDGRECLESVLGYGLRVMLDPYVTDHGTTRWTEVTWEDRIP